MLVFINSQIHKYSGWVHNEVDRYIPTQYMLFCSILFYILNFYMQTVLQKQYTLPNRYNLFSQQPPVCIKPLRTPKVNKAQIKIIFQHPNLLYLSDKRVKTKQEISQQIQQKLRAMIKNRSKNSSQSKLRTRPATSDFSYTHSHASYGFKDEPLRCKTSAGSWRGMQRRRKQEVEGGHTYPFQDFEKDGFLGMKKIDVENGQKDKSPRASLLSRPQRKSEAKLNIYIEMERRIFNYNNRTIKSGIKKSRQPPPKQNKQF